MSELRDLVQNPLLRFWGASLWVCVVQRVKAKSFDNQKINVRGSK